MHREHLTEEERAGVYDTTFPLLLRLNLAVRFTWELRAKVADLEEEVRHLREAVPYGGQGFVNSAGQYTDMEGRTHPFREP